MNLRSFVLSLRIRVKLLIAFGSILFMSVLLIVLSIRSINRIIYYKSINEQVDFLKLHLETIDLATKEFIYEGFKSPSFLQSRSDVSIDKFNKSLTDAKAIILSIAESEVGQAAETTTMTRTLSIALDSLQNEFFQLTDLLNKRGFKDAGLEGSLRRAIHTVENSDYTFDKASLLTLRRHEKDFFLRKDLKYQQEFDNKITEFIASLRLMAAPDALLTNLENYRSQFNTVVDIEQKIGLKENEGIRGAIRKNFEHVRPQVEIFRTLIKQKSEAQIVTTQTVLIVIFLVQLIAGLVLAIVYANLVTMAIKEIRSAMLKLATGIFPDQMVVRTTEEIGQTKEAFNQFIVRLKEASDFAEKLGSGELKAVYNENYSNDVLAQSIIKMQKRLLEAEEKQAKINWSNRGSAQFNDLLKNEFDSIEVLADKILRQFVMYVDANQGALFLIETKEGNNVLRRVAAYAYGKKKFSEETIDAEAGLLGQCIAEKSSVYIKDIPRDFVKITSGLGEATPRNVLIVPLKIREDVLGALELASFSMFENHQIEFLERIAESVATLLSNRRSDLETKKLLQESVHRSNMLSQQEEEMRQNAEELQATQEAMERQRAILLQEISDLKKRLKQFEGELAAH